MALKDQIPFGISLPHRSPEPIDISVVRQVAERADRLGFRDLWVTENTLDHVFCFDPIVILTYAAAITTKIRLGVAVVVLPIHHPAMVAHKVATLDYASNGRALLGLGIGRDHHYDQFQIPREKRVRRFLEGVELMKALWTQPEVNYHGTIYQLEHGTMAPKGVHKPHPPIWLGGGHPNALKRAATIADAWMGSGGSSRADFARSVPVMRENLEKAGRDPRTFPLSKRVFLSVHERTDTARAELHHWFTTVYHNPNGAENCGVYGTPEQVREKIEELVAAGATHLLLNPVCRHTEQLEALAKIVGLS